MSAVAPMRITIVIHGITLGGAERAAVNLANHWARTGKAITLLTFDRGTEAPAFALDPSIEHRPLGSDTKQLPAIAKVPALVPLLAGLRRAIVASRPDAVLSFMAQTNVLTLLATVGLEVPVVVSEQCNPETKATTAGERLAPVRLVAGRLRDRCYARARAVVVQTEGVRAHYPPAVRRNMVVIANPVVAPEARAPDLEIARPTVLSMGRLAEPKRFDLLIRAFARMADRFPDWSVTIVGGGPQLETLQALARAEGLGERVHFPGSTATAHAVLARAEVFAFVSDNEGFPGVLCEALASGCPTVATACPHGPAEIVVDEENGLLVPPDDLDALTDALARLLGDAALRERLGGRAPEVLDRFGTARVAEAFEQAMRAV